MLLVIESSRHWWAFLLRGLAAVSFGVLAIAWPGLTLTVLVLFWGAYALVDGVLALVAAMLTQHDHRWGLVLEGVAGIGAGLVTFFYPDLTALVLVYIIAAWAIITGVLDLFVAPGAGALALVWLIAAYAIIFGVLLIALSFRLHGLGQRRQAMGMA